MFAAYLQVSRTIDSATVRSTAMDSLSDVLSTGIVLASVITYALSGVNIDGIAGIIVALFILKTGIDSAKDTINPLLGEPPSKQFLKEIEQTVMSHGDIYGVHDIVVHNYGPSRIMMSLHVEVPSDKTLTEIHDTVDSIEKELRQKYHCTAVIHMDPVDMSDTETAGIKELLKAIIRETDPAIKFHDLRIIRKNAQPPRVEFDMEIPYRFRLKDQELINIVEDRLRSVDPDYRFDITIDKGQKDKED
jgi:divalent metal cation (Fe/Co/Zn/Cd) transporter